MAKLSVEEYDKLSPEQQKAHDASEAEREQREQAGGSPTHSRSPVASADGAVY